MLNNRNLIDQPSDVPSVTVIKSVHIAFAEVIIYRSYRLIEEPAMCADEVANKSTNMTKSIKVEEEPNLF